MSPALLLRGSTCILALALSVSAQSAPWFGRCVAVLDGDTIEVKERWF